MIATDRLTPAERDLYEAMFPNGIKPGVEADPNGPRVSSFDATWVFGACCYRHPAIGTVPAPVIDLLEARAYRPCIEFELYGREVAKLRAERGARRRRVWRLMILMAMRRSVLRAEREAAERRRRQLRARLLRWVGSATLLIAFTVAAIAAEVAILAVLVALFGGRGD